MKKLLTSLLVLMSISAYSGTILDESRDILLNTKNDKINCISLNNNIEEVQHCSEVINEIEKLLFVTENSEDFSDLIIAINHRIRSTRGHIKMELNQLKFDLEINYSDYVTRPLDDL